MHHGLPVPIQRLFSFHTGRLQFFLFLYGSAPDCRLLLHASIAPADFVRLILVNPRVLPGRFGHFGQRLKPDLIQLLRQR